MTSEPELSCRCKAGLPTNLCEVGLRDGVAKSNTLGVVAAVTGMANAIVVRALTSRAVPSVGSAVAVGTTATEGAVSPVWAPLSIWVTAHVTTARDPNTVTAVVGATLWAPAVVGVVCRITAGRDPNAILSTLGVGTGGLDVGCSSTPVDDPSGRRETG